MKGSDFLGGWPATFISRVLICSPVVNHLYTGRARFATGRAIDTRKDSFNTEGTEKGAQREVRKEIPQRFFFAFLCVLCALCVKAFFGPSTH